MIAEEIGADVRITKIATLLHDVGKAVTHKIEGKHILLVDDVFTTGATIEACAKEILKIKNTKISILTMAYSKL